MNAKADSNTTKNNSKDALKPATNDVPAVLTVYSDPKFPGDVFVPLEWVVEPDDGATVRDINSAKAEQYAASYAELGGFPRGQLESIAVYKISEKQYGFISGRHRKEAGHVAKWTHIRCRVEDAPATPAERLLRSAAFNLQNPMTDGERTRNVVQYLRLAGGASGMKQKDIGRATGVNQSVVSEAMKAFGKATPEATTAYLESKCTFEQYKAICELKRDVQRGRVKTDDFKGLIAAGPKGGRLSKREAENFQDVAKHLIPSDIREDLIGWLVNGDEDARKRLVLKAEALNTPTQAT